MYGKMPERKKGRRLNSRKMQAGPAVAPSQTGGPKTDEAEEELKRKSTQVVIYIFIYI